jgi:peptide/nickel transport system substrate-binding protein
VVNIGYPGANFSSDDGTFNSPCVEKLITLDAKGNLIPWLTTGWQISPDYKSITFTIRKGVKFHDGTDFNAAAAKFNLDLVRNGPRPDLKTIASVDVVDDYTIRLNYVTYDPALLNNLAFAASWQVSPTAIKTNGVDWAMTHPVGTGPYVFVGYTRDVSVKYVRFDAYWGGRPYLDGLEFDLIADPVTALASFKAGEAQASIIVGLKDAADMQATGKYNVNSCVSNAVDLAPDSGNATSPFYDIRVRQAVAYAIDSATIAKTVGYGFYDATNQLATIGGYSYNPAVVGYPYNPQKAKQLLTDAGYASGFQTTITYQQSPESQDTYTAVQAYLSAVGITAKLDPADTARFVNTYTVGWKNGLVHQTIACSVGSDPARALLSNLSSKRMQYASVALPADYDAALLAASTEPDAAKRKTQFQNVMKMIIDQYCMVIPIYRARFVGVSSAQVHDFSLNNIAPGVWHPETVWLSK